MWDGHSLLRDLPNDFRRHIQIPATSIAVCFVAHKAAKFQLLIDGNGSFVKGYGLVEGPKVTESVSTDSCNGLRGI